MTARVQPFEARDNVLRLSCQRNREAGTADRCVRLLQPLVVRRRDDRARGRTVLVQCCAAAS